MATLSLYRTNDVSEAPLIVGGHNAHPQQILQFITTELYPGAVSAVSALREAGYTLWQWNFTRPSDPVVLAGTTRHGGTCRETFVVQRPTG